MLHFGELLKTWSLRSSSVTRQVTFIRTKIGGKCQNSKIQMRDILSNFQTMWTMIIHWIHKNTCKTEASWACPSISYPRVISKDSLSAFSQIWNWSAINRVENPWEVCCPEYSRDLKYKLYFQSIHYILIHLPIHVSHGALGIAQFFDIFGHHFARAKVSRFGDFEYTHILQYKLSVFDCILNLGILTSGTESSDRYESFEASW